METYEESCRKHPYQSVIGVCAYCLSDRLRLLCPDCAAPRPCKCLLSSGAASSENLSTSSASSSFSSSFDHLKHPPSRDGIGAVGRISNLIDAEPPFRRCKSSRIAGISFIRSRSRVSQRWSYEEPVPISTPSGPRKKWSLWSFLLPDKSKKEPKPPPEKTGPTATRLSISRSVGVSYSSYSFKDTAAAAGGGDGGGSASSGKGRRWSFSSPISVFRQTKTVNGMSPMCRG